MEFEKLLEAFLAKLEKEGRVSQEAREAFHTCYNIQELIQEVSMWIKQTKGDMDKAASYILYKACDDYSDVKS